MLFPLEAAEVKPGMKMLKEFPNVPLAVSVISVSSNKTVMEFEPNLIKTSQIKDSKKSYNAKYIVQKAMSLFQTRPPYLS